MSLPLNVDEGAPAAPVKDASTVMLLRDGPAGLEVFLVRRVAGMAFAGGTTVFPGGGVDPSDADPSLTWAGPDASWWSARLGIEGDQARARRLVCAAARETFEECGVLLAGYPAADVSAGSTTAASAGSTAIVDGARFHGARDALEAHELGFAHFLTREGLTFDTELLRPWSRWITPVGEKRRYDTYFFVAALPERQEADGRTSEAAEVAWSTPEAALEHWRAGRSMLLPPTWAQLDGLCAYSTVADVMAAQPEIRPIQPDLVRTERGWIPQFDGAQRYVEQMPREWLRGPGR